MTARFAFRGLLAATLAALALSAQAVEMNGYFRDSTGFNSKGGSMACFQLPGSYFKARLGNECDRYLEMDFSQTGKVEGSEWRAEFMPASYLPTSGGANSLFIQQMWMGLKIPDLGGANLWAGRRYWNRHDVHSIDWFYWNPAQGNSAVGVEDIGLGFGKLALTLIRMDAQVQWSTGTATTPAVSSNLLKGAYMVPDVRLTGIAVNPDATLELGVDLAMASDQKLKASDIPTGAGTPTVVVGDPALGHNRAGTSFLLTAQHNQGNLLGGSNTFAVQYGNGAFAKTTGDGPGQLLAGGTTDDKQWRIIEHLVMNLTPEFSSAVVVVYQDIKTAGTSDNGAGIFSGEIRPSYQFNNWFKLSGDLFYQTISVKNASPGVKSANLTKVTVAPTFVLGRGYYARPELRLFATYGAWNDGAVAMGGVGGGAFGDSKSGMSYGAQAEIWF